MRNIRHFFSLGYVEKGNLRFFGKNVKFFRKPILQTIVKTKKKRVLEFLHKEVYNEIANKIISADSVYRVVSCRYTCICT